MAERRMISKSLSGSKKFTKLKTDSARMLYMLLQPHTDDFGRFDADPFTIKNIVIPTLSHSEDKIQSFLDDMLSVRLIDIWEIDGNKVLEIKLFEKHQPGLHKRTNPKYPNKPKGSQFLPGSSQNVPEVPASRVRLEGKGREGKGREGKKDISTERKKDSAPVPPNIDFCFKTEEFSNITEKEIIRWEKAYPAVDVNREILAAAAWMAAHPARRKKNWKSFLTRWISRAQEKGGTKGYVPKLKSKTDKLDEKVMKELEDMGT